MTFWNDIYSNIEKIFIGNWHHFVHFQCIVYFNNNTKVKILNFSWIEIWNVSLAKSSLSHTQIPSWLMLMSKTKLLSNLNLVYNPLFIVMNLLCAFINKFQTWYIHQMYWISSGSILWINANELNWNFVYNHIDENQIHELRASMCFFIAINYTMNLNCCCWFFFSIYANIKVKLSRSSSHKVCLCCSCHVSNCTWVTLQSFWYHSIAV